MLNVNAVGDIFNNALAHEAGFAAQVIYGWWGAEQLPRLHWRDVENKFGQKGHDQGPEEFLAIFDFADEIFFGKARGPSTYNVAPKSDTWRYDPAKFPLLIDWSVPPLDRGSGPATKPKSEKPYPQCPSQYRSSRSRSLWC